MNDERMTELLNAKIEWMGKLYREAENLEQYQWTRVNGVRHRCGGEIDRRTCNRAKRRKQKNHQLLIETANIWRPA